MRLINFVVLPVTAWLLPLVARADNLSSSEFLDDIGSAAEYGTPEGASLPVLVGNVINIFLSVIGVILVVLMVYGGYLWMTARGDDDRVKQAKQTIQNAIIGLVIILLAYSISSFVVNKLVNASFGIR